MSSPPRLFRGNVRRNVRERSTMRRPLQGEGANKVGHGRRRPYMGAFAPGVLVRGPARRGAPIALWLALGCSAVCGAGCVRKDVHEAALRDLQEARTNA